MNLSPAFVPVLSQLSQPFSRQADTLLDLRDCVNRQVRPGRCITCYFDLQEAAAEARMAQLCPLRHWLEAHIEIVARDTESKALEILPVNLENAADLEAFCRGVMAEFSENRAYEASQIQLEFRYRAPALAA